MSDEEKRLPPNRAGRVPEVLRSPSQMQPFWQQLEAKLLPRMRQHHVYPRGDQEGLGLAAPDRGHRAPWHRLARLFCSVSLDLRRALLASLATPGSLSEHERQRVPFEARGFITRTSRAITAGKKLIRH